MEWLQSIEIVVLLKLEYFDVIANGVSGLALIGSVLSRSKQSQEGRGAQWGHSVWTVYPARNKVCNIALCPYIVCMVFYMQDPEDE